jgi:putative two-component system response regulator
MEPTIPLNSKQILVVEDNAEIREVIAQVLRIENYQVYQASDGVEALKIVETIVPDLILSDINMPRMSGKELFYHARKDPRIKAIPFVFLTGVSKDQSHHTLQELGVEDWVTKPIDTKKLTQTISARLLRAAEVKIALIDQAYLETIEVLASAVESRDYYTKGHIERVSTYSIWIAKELRWPSENLRILEYGSRLHDIGKIIVPDKILNKPEKLSPKDWILMRKHPEAGARILNKISHLKPVVPYILFHHEKWNGTGYPYMKKGRDIPLGARILALADVYDALTTTRPYRPALHINHVFQYLEFEKGKHFDPDLVPLFIEILKSSHQTVLSHG